MSIPIATRQAYTEIDNFIELLDEDTKNKVPQKLRAFFKTEKDKNYIKNINVNQPIKNQELKPETLALIAMLNLQYWCEDENEKERLKNVYAKNENLYQEKLKNKYNLDNIFKNRKKEETIPESNISKENAIIEYKEQNFIQRLFEKIKHLFKRKY